MTIDETRKIVLSYLPQAYIFIKHTYDNELKINNNGYKIRPDDAFYFHKQIILIEYENNIRPVESIGKYFWLFEKTDWAKIKLPIHLLLTINNKRVEKNYKIRTETIEILGNKLSRLYPSLFYFYFINYSEITESRIINTLEQMQKF